MQAEAGIRLQPAGPHSPPVNAAEVSGESLHRRPGPDSSENKLLLLDTNEAITDLVRKAAGYAWMAQWLRRGAPTQAEGRATPEEWLQIYQDLDDVERDLGQMKLLLRLDRTLLFRAYHRFLVIQENWLYCRRRDFSRNGEMTSEGDTAVHEDKVFLTDIFSKIKRMLVATR